MDEYMDIELVFSEGRWKGSFPSQVSQGATLMLWISDSKWLSSEMEREGVHFK